MWDLEFRENLACLESETFVLTVLKIKIYSLGTTPRALEHRYLEYPELILLALKSSCNPNSLIKRVLSN